MKLKLMFLLVIVLSGSCAKKNYKKTDYSYYKREITKLRNSEKKNIRPQKETSSGPVTDASARIQYLSPEEKKKFATLLRISEDSLTNEKLYAAITKWLETPYRWGGTSPDGVDCSSLTQQIYEEVYDKEIPRTSLQQFYFDTRAQFKNQDYLKEGDLVFFRLRFQDEIVSHVGIYLQNGKFLGSNSPRGVEITDLDTPYWQDKYVASARLLK
ncbi:C40 family peptidase [Pricia sp. S334]|uniref:C40 family peptidase n=1 Tax=Pricia mediterranea TaxID=3076079 RepID=A0ABU3LA61_9FLAO|nr:C40 family peptidase [Pricia sp. S334]MDT7830630.1 C40 family peptidase [Pricia sp. S334]